jgi:rhamnopyranosyl-N-acetylglucosaminyl-diphospho-decaprenol beta-1,3/1,4-galactofuranosyltransferase
MVEAWASCDPGTTTERAQGGRFTMSERQGRRIVALVLTNNAPRSLARCLDAIGAQTEVPDEVLIVDNASEPPVKASLLPTFGRSLRVIRSEVNGGPAGGWAIALHYFSTNDFTHAWVMDDDIVPEPTCLEHLWGAASDAPTSAFVFPIAIQPDDSVGRWGSWCGFLISREIVETVGLPMEALFWWAEDAEYCEWRIPRAGFPRRVIDEAVVHHDAIRQGDKIPKWKYYYESRNMLYYHLHVMHRVGRYPKKITTLFLRALLRQRKDRIGYLGAICRGLYDGAFGHLGISYPVSSLHERDLSSSAASHEMP